MRSLVCAIGSCLKRRKGDGKEAISSSLLGKVSKKRYQGLQDRDFESINCEQRAIPSSFVVPYVDLVRVGRGGRRPSSSRRRHAVSGERILIAIASIISYVNNNFLIEQQFSIYHNYVNN